MMYGYVTRAVVINWLTNHQKIISIRGFGLLAEQKVRMLLCDDSSFLIHQAYEENFIIRLVRLINNLKKP